MLTTRSWWHCVPQRASPTCTESLIVLQLATYEGFRHVREGSKSRRVRDKAERRDARGHSVCLLLRTQNAPGQTWDSNDVSGSLRSPDVRSHPTQFPTGLPRVSVAAVERFLSDAPISPAASSELTGDRVTARLATRIRD